MLYTFHDYVLDPQRHELRQQGVPVPLERKAYHVLVYLVQRADRLVTKRELLEAVWPEVYVNDSAVACCIGAVRQAVGDRRETQGVIRTVHGQGYRFVAPVVVQPDAAGATSPADPAPPVPAPAAVPVPPAPAPVLLVGRAAEVAQLQACWGQAQQGGRQLVFVTGEAGIGKTTVVDAFLAQVGAAQSVRIGRGQCIEHYGAGEAYLPVLEALGRLGRAPGGEHLVTCLRQYAPTWLLHLPALRPPEASAAGTHSLPGVTRERMVRELAEALEALAAAQPLVLVLEDLHWSDPSTVEALALLARRRDAAQLLVLGTYRPVELIVYDHPLKTVKQELLAHGQCVEIPMGYLPQEAVAAYLARRGVASEDRDGVAAFVYRRTDGHPLFMVQVVDDLAQQGRLQTPVPLMAEGTGGEAVDLVLPQGLRHFLEAQLGRLDAVAQEVLAVGSVAGAEFSVAGVAVGVQTAPEAVEAVCERLARQGQFLEGRGLVEWPDGTVGGRYGWRHALYQEVVYARLGAGRQARWHRVIGERLEQAYGARAPEMAAELALHFQRGQDATRAVRYLQQAAETTARRQAPHEVIALLTTALDLLATLPETPARAQQELAMQLALGTALGKIKGLAAPELEQIHAWVRALGAQVGETPQHLQIVLGVYWFHLVRGALSTAQELGEELVQLAQRTARPADLLTAYTALGYTAFLRGDYGAAQTHCAQGMTRLDPLTQRAQAVRSGYAMGVDGLSIAANTLWCLGFPVQAEQCNQEALALAQAVGHPQSLAFAYLFAIYVQQRRREVPAVQAQAEALVTLATAQGFPHFVGYGTFWQGWALARQGQHAGGLAQMYQGLAAMVATGSLVAQPLYLVWLAEATGQAGDVEAGLRLLADALETCTTTGRGDGLAEAYRLHGELLLQSGGQPPAAEAAACFPQALTVARRQQAKSWELRAATSLSRLWQQQGKRQEAYDVLAPIYHWFTEGFDTADLQDAKTLLDTLA
jgi:DNA-binding winged helix-turn-helix (wHTH) protein/predicted ATPase